ncbi:hypothetical protein [Peribacillus sp. ACCC06369]|uniref:hypothetical protein n=1 Tax=Peribacillus sp. ACCC06369 TaxID=3055860 RepID=UPI0025A078E2|nr:hypothetical protein [Peribacillus sp. ACCC06369]
MNDSQQVLFFSFDSIIFINYSHTDEIKEFSTFIHSFEPDIDLVHVDRYTDGYCLHSSENENIRQFDRRI